MKEVLIFISDEYADWGIGYIGSEIRKTMCKNRFFYNCKWNSSIRIQS